MSRYTVDGKDLTRIADAIRAKGKNQFDPETSQAPAEPGKRYTFSADVTWDGTLKTFGTLVAIVSSGNSQVWNKDYQTAPAAGTVRREHITTTSMPENSIGLKFNPKSELTITNIQIEEGTTATEYTEPIGPLVFPDGFVSAIQGI